MTPFPTLSTPSHPILHSHLLFELPFRQGKIEWTWCHKDTMSTVPQAEMGAPSLLREIPLILLQVSPKLSLWMGLLLLLQPKIIFFSLLCEFSRLLPVTASELVINYPIWFGYGRIYNRFPQNTVLWINDFSSGLRAWTAPCAKQTQLKQVVIVCLQES